MVELALVGNYIYDAWGNVLSMTPAGTGNVQDANRQILEFNPFRWKGYYFDVPTGFYYLQSRYYDPQTGRFINADEPTMLLTESAMAMGGNLYMYCYNNPIMFRDDSGYGFFTAFLISSIVIGVLVGSVIGGHTAVANGAELGSREFWGGVAGGAIMGGAMGAVLAIGGAAGFAGTAAAKAAGFAFMSKGAAFALSLGIGAGAGFISYSANTGISGNDWNWGHFALSGLSGMTQAAATFGIAFGAGKMGMFAKKLTGKYNWLFLTNISKLTGKSLSMSAAKFSSLVTSTNVGSALLRTGMIACVRKAINSLYWLMA